MPSSENISAILRSAGIIENNQSDETYREVRAQQIALLFRQLPAALTATLLIAFIVMGVTWPVADAKLLLPWFIAVCALTGHRFLLWRRFSTNAPRAEQMEPWLRSFFAGTLLSGILWGAGGVLLAGQDLIHQFFFGLLLAGLAAGGVSTLSSYRGVYAAYLLPSMVPFAVRMALYLDPAHIAMGSMMLLFVALMLGISARIHATIAESLRLRFRNLGLVDSLSAAKGNLEEANSALQREIGEHRKAQEILMKSEQKLRLHAHQAPLAFIEWDLSFRVVEWNPAAERIFGYSRQEALGRHAATLIAAERSCDAIAAQWKRLLIDKHSAQLTIENRTKGERNIVCEWYYTPLVDAQGRVLSVMTLAHDVTANRQAQERLNYLAYHDELTGLPNRSLYNDRLSQAMIEARRQGRYVGVMLLDIDHFKMVNDTMGHDAGDELLRDIGRRLSVCVRESDTVARFGGDEFGLVLAGMADPRDAMFVAQKMLDSFAPPFFVGGRELFVGPSIGITIYPVDSDDIDGLTKNADSAMYHAKAQGRNNFQFYSADLTARARSRLDMETSLRRALERREFLLHYQPKFRVDTGAMTGAEALIRWQHPELGMVPPQDFIGIAEESGLILPIGEWVLREACQQVMQWHAEGLGQIKLAVNLSTKQFRHGRLKETLAAVLSETGFDPRYLEFEITESVLMESSTAVREVLADLKAMGISISLDDFGTGYSSLSYLKRFPIDALKIDRTFVRDIPADQDDAAIVRAIIAMARSLRMKVIAEGVETVEQQQFLRAEGCDEIQGYLPGRPVPPGEFRRMLQSRKAPT
jgi:diguanylate cyclase (GGDEF)-like protein/PAS domain S-box-containing protein